MPTKSYLLPSPNKIINQKLPINTRCVSMGEGMKEVPIFTEEFMALNKAMETELKQLRKSVTDGYNAILC